MKITSEFNQPPTLVLAAYQFCKIITQNHAENFPVASLIIPKKQRQAITALYAFSRLADDFADEEPYKTERMERLHEWQFFLEQSQPTHPVFIAIQDVIQRFELPQTLLQDLLIAFKMDVTKNRHQSFEDLLHYCHYSANPVGRMVLHLFGFTDSYLLNLSDTICTGLQLANFWQDIAVDLEKNRIYVPQNDLTQFALTDSDLFAKTLSKNFCELVEYEIERTIKIFQSGKELGLIIPGRLGLELRLVWLGGMTILKKIRAARYDIFNHRPTVNRRDFFKLLFIALNKNQYRNFS